MNPDTLHVFHCLLAEYNVHWEERKVLNPSAIIKDDKVYLVYWVQDRTGTSRIGLAVSKDGLNLEKYPVSVFYPNKDDMQWAEWHYKKGEEMVGGEDYYDGVEDPRIDEGEDKRYYMTYTAYDIKMARLCIASIVDLHVWEKHGLVL